MSKKFTNNEDFLTFFSPLKKLDLSARITHSINHEGDEYFRAILVDFKKEIERQEIDYDETS